LDITKRALTTVASSLLITSQIVIFFGFDASILWGISWLPYLFWASGFCASPQSKPYQAVFLACLIAFVINHSANQVAGLLVITSIIFQISLTKNSNKNSMVLFLVT